MGDTADYDHGQPKPVPTSGPSMHDLVIEDIQERKDYGLNKYNSLLQAHNGRNFLKDLYEELHDATVYARGALVEQETVVKLVKKLLEGYLYMHDELYPESRKEVIVTAANLPGWLLDIHKEVLGDRFEYLAG